MPDPCQASHSPLAGGVSLADARIRSVAIDLATIDLTFTSNIRLRFQPTDPEVLEWLAQQHDPDSDVPDDLFTRMARFLRDGKLGSPKVLTDPPRTG